MKAVLHRKSHSHYSIDCKSNVRFCLCTKLLSNGKLITRDEFLSDSKNCHSKKSEKHLCKSNGVRWMNSDRLNALIVQHTLTSILSHGFLFALFFFLSGVKCRNVSTTIHSGRFHRTEDRRMYRIERFHCIFPFTCRFTILSMLPFRFTSTQKYFTIDFLWHMQHKKKCPDEISQSMGCNKIL